LLRNNKDFDGVWLIFILRFGKLLRMKSKSMVTVPEGMSCVNAFHAIWKMSRPVALLNVYPQFAAQHAETVSTAQKVAALFRNRTFFENEGGKAMRMDFSNFPIILCDERDLSMAIRALNQYRRIPRKDRFDPLDTYKFSELTGARIVSRL
jgi:hypothetical protein